jgi:hypothetical protein
MRTNSGDRGDLEILREIVLVDFPRGRDGRERLRLRFVQARAGDREVAWHDLREFWKDERGEWRPGKKGVSLRGRELGPIRDALIRATRGANAAPAREATKAPVPSSPSTPTAEERRERTANQPPPREREPVSR